MLFTIVTIVIIEILLSINKRQHAMHNVPFVNSSLSDTYYSLSINDSMQCIMFLLLTLLYQIRMHKDSNYHYSNKAQKDSPYISFHQGSKVFVLYSLMDECDHI